VDQRWHEESLHLALVVDSPGLTQAELLQGVWLNTDEEEFVESGGLQGCVHNLTNEDYHQHNDHEEHRTATFESRAESQSPHVAEVLVLWQLCGFDLLTGEEAENVLLS
jgi:hypothetical protein